MSLDPCAYCAAPELRRVITRRGLPKLTPLVNALQWETIMISTKRQIYESSESFDAKHAEHSDSDKSDFKIVIELDDSEMARVAGGYLKYTYTG